MFTFFNAIKKYAPLLSSVSSGVCMTPIVLQYVFGLFSVPSTENSLLPVRSKTHNKIKRTLFNWTKQDKMC